jgi:hydrogenase nickel incorporation protein HypA/HybF
MHEMALCEGIVEIIEREAERQSFSRVRAVLLELGALSHAEPEALRFCFDAVTRDTRAAGARLEIVPVGGTAWCLDCAKSVAIAARGEACPTCGGYHLRVTAGDEMRLKELEVD